MPISEAERARAILTWACPVFSVVGKVVYPTEEVLKKVDALARAVMGIKSWGLTTQILTQRKEQGRGRTSNAIGVLETPALEVLRAVSATSGLRASTTKGRI